MGKVAFVFAGQGAQYSGMGRTLCERSEAARKVFEAADAIRPGTSKQCFEGSEDELKQTKFTQPCMFTVEMAAAAALAEAGIQADLTAGFSLGELAALTYSGVVDNEAGLKLVMRRGELMQQAAESQADTSMAAVLKLDNETIEQLCARYEHVYPVNYNCPGQVSVSGLSSEMQDFFATVKEAGGRAIPLKVSGAFHSPYMVPAAEAFAEELQDVTFQTPQIPLYSNKTGLPYEGDMRQLLSQQICNPVRWETIIRSMIAEGVDTFCELGPGKTLCGLIKKIDSSVRTFGIAEAADLDAALEELA